MSALALISASAASITINTMEDLENINSNLSGDYVLGQSIDAAGFAFDPIGGTFSGTLDGGGHAISNLTTDSPAGLFNTIGQTGTVRDLNLANVNVTGYRGVGGLASTNYGTITDVHVTGTVAGTYIPNDLTGGGVGGLVAVNQGLITRSSAAASVSGGNDVGGLVGDDNLGGTITQSFATGMVSGQNFVGGLVGFSDWYRPYQNNVSDVYATNTVTGTGVDVGGLLGGAIDTTLTNAYAAGKVTGGQAGGLISSDVFDFNATNAYWDTAATTQANSGGGSPQTTAYLQSGSLPSGFDASVWKATPGQYPALQWQSIAPGPAPSPNPCKPTDADFFQKAVGTPTPSGATISASFDILGLVSAGCTITDVAHSFGYDHFNWIQAIIRWPGCLAGLRDAQGNVVSAPPAFLDPPPGGYSGAFGTSLGSQYADQLPYYWDEGSDPKLDPQYLVGANTSGVALQFNDTPHDQCISLTGLSMGFTTSLVGVFADSTHSDPLDSFTWSSDAWCVAGHCLGGVSRYLTARDDQFVGGVFDIHDLENPLDLPPDVITLLQTDEAPAPEPNSLSLLAGVVFVLLAFHGLAKTRVRLTI